MPRLDREDRAVLEQVSAAIFANPFSQARVETDLLLSGLARDQVGDGARRTERSLSRIEGALQAAGGDALHLDHFGGKDRLLIERALAFVAYYRRWADFEALEARGRESSGPVAAPFVTPLIDGLVRHGVERIRARRYVELFWQLWRAWLFIDRGLTGRSPSMVRLRERLWNNVFTHDLELYDHWLAAHMEDFSTILLGETGSGKGAAAAAIGRSGYIPLRDDERGFLAEPSETFLAINLSEFSPGIIESELFGHKKGAFTGAIEAHEGLLGRCSAHGSVFLDEIGELDLPLQTKLLRVLQERTYSPVGSHDARRFAGRIIVATNRDLDAMRATGAFRDDFYFRLCGDVIRLPNLRDRLDESPEELEQLVEALLERILPPPRYASPAALGAPSAAEVRERVLAAMHSDLPGGAAAYAWPGNVRELEQCIRGILLRGRVQPTTTAGHDQDALSVLQHGVDLGEFTATQLVAAYCRLLYERFGTFEAVARRVDLDRRTVKKHIQKG